MRAKACSAYNIMQAAAVVYCANSLNRLHLRVVRLYLHCGILHWADI